MTTRAALPDIGSHAGAVSGNPRPGGGSGQRNMV